MVSFPNIPVSLQSSMDKACRRFLGGSDMMIGHIAAGNVLGEYLGKDTVKKYLESISAGKTSREQMRFVMLAEKLFLIRSEPGFTEFCRRIRTRDLRGAFFELIAAQLFWRAGFAIHARPETGIKGQDYDFWVERNQERINVEATNLTANTYSQNTVLNSLNKKRKQLPSDAPSVVFCSYPDEWLSEPADWNFRMILNAFEFLRRTRRVNVVLFWADMFVGNQGGGGALGYLGNAYFNVNPYFGISDTRFFAADRSLMAAKDVGSLTEKDVNKSEFFEWIADARTRAQA